MKAYQGHLGKIRWARDITAGATDALEQARILTAETRALTREMLFDHLTRCQMKLAEEEDLNKASWIVARGVQSLIALHGPEFPSGKTAARPKVALENGLSPDQREQIERECDLM